MSPALDLAVFSGQHALHAVDPAGGLRWRVRHACWGPTCLSYHDSYQEYADRRNHRHPDHGSCWISADASTVWAHLRTALPEDVEVKLDEQWLVLDAADGRLPGPGLNRHRGRRLAPHPAPRPGPDGHERRGRTVRVVPSSWRTGRLAAYAHRRNTPPQRGTGQHTGGQVGLDLIRLGHHDHHGCSRHE